MKTQKKTLSLLTSILALTILLTSCGKKTADKEAYFGKYIKIEKTITDSTIAYGIISTKGNLVALYEYSKVTTENIDKGLLTLHKASGEKNYLTEKGVLLKQISSLDELPNDNYNTITPWDSLINFMFVFGAIFLIFGAIITIDIKEIRRIPSILFFSGVTLIISVIVIEANDIGNNYMGGQKTKLTVENTDNYGLTLNGKCLLENKYSSIEDFDKNLCYGKINYKNIVIVDKDGNLYKIIKK